jgi:tRNA (Thr-GGU) A37 N-methylase
MVSPIFESCHQLEYIDMEPVRYSDSQQSYQRWAHPHGSEAPVMLGVFQKDSVRRPFSII